MDDLYINTQEALVELCAQLRRSPWLALDTEFIREKTYYPQLCLVQVADEHRVACIDPLVLNNLEPLFEILYDLAITKVLHSAHQDLEIFFNLCNTVPYPVFDTQLAATLLGQGEQVGYATLVKTLLGLELDKSQTRTDWSRRPLEAEQLRYAMDDVRYLRQIYHHQRTELQARQRLDWLADDFRELCAPTKYCIRPDETWRRVKGGQQLSGVELAVLRALAAWREEEAIKANRPRKWILSDQVLLELARQMPRDAKSLKPNRTLEPNTLKRHGQKLFDLIAEARNEPPANWPIQPSRLHLNPEQEALVDALMAVIRLRGAEKAVSPHTLASRKDLERLVTRREDIHLLHGWRAAVAGREVQALLQGERTLHVHEGKLHIMTNR